MRIVLLAGGVGGARFTRGLLDHLVASGTAADVTVVANTGDDIWMNGLRLCPDLDTMMYTLGGGIHEEQGWGRADESRRVADELDAYGVGVAWFTLGDLDLATHIARTQLLREGNSLSAATARLCARWKPGVRLLPMSDEPVETHVRLAGSDQLMHFEEWWVRLRATVPAQEFVQSGVEDASPAPGVLDAIRDADVVVLPPSNPVVSIGTILGVPGIRDAVRETSGRVVGVSPIIGGAAVRGMAAACLTTIGVATSADAVAVHYGPRSRGGLLDAWLVDETDAVLVPGLAADGIPCRAVPLWLRDTASSARLAADALAMAERD
ncbi:2-phospho-L-lactate transferase [Luethyella okanaganae]|uniref:2-phospho-L-lactate transferase n=1 Tax=Luethyella okanaganae TaxID=69372 RepID=A0ABW1VL25_9MICO